MSGTYLNRLNAVFLNLATCEVFPNLFRGDDLLYFNADREEAANAIEGILAEAPEVSSNSSQVLAAREVLQALKSFDQSEFSQSEGFMRQGRHKKIVDFYAKRFSEVLDESTLDVRTYVGDLSSRTLVYVGGVEVPDSLNIVE